MIHQPTPTPAGITDFPISWHPTTPRHFACQAGCVCCCVTTLFFPGEMDALPIELRAHLGLRQGLIRPQRRPPGVCVFFDAHAPWHCQIPKQRPLRCRLYPYLPLITDEAIIIVADPFCTISWPETNYPDWFRCYGLGRGPDITTDVVAMCREFVRNMVDEYPNLMHRHLYVDDVDSWINWQEVDKHRHPRYPEWDTETIRQATQSGAEMEPSPSPPGVTRKETP